MRVRIVAVLAGLAALLVSPPSAFAWRSMVMSTHKDITKKALSLIDRGAYPDLIRASDLLVSGSDSEAGHEASHTGGGRVKMLWERGLPFSDLTEGVLPAYRLSHSSAAYRNLGVLIHLTEDMAVPAHAAKIEHGMKHLDAMESFADHSVWKYAVIPKIDSAGMPYDYYQRLQDDTRAHLPSWRNPATGVPYWVMSEQAPTRGQDATAGPRGHYGDGSDTYASSDVNSAPGKRSMSPSPEIADDRLGAAAGHAKAALESASRRLPPLVMDLALSPNRVSAGQPAEIGFTALENRTKSIRCVVVVTRDGSPVETVASGTVSLNDPGPGEYLFRRQLSFRWDGLIAGKPAGPGNYAVAVTLTDEDGNSTSSGADQDSLQKAGFTVAEPLNMPAAESRVMSMLSGPTLGFDGAPTR